MAPAHHELSISMQGILFHKSHSDAMSEALADHNIEPIEQVRVLLHWWLFVFEGDRQTELAATVLTLRGLIPPGLTGKRRSALEPKLVPAGVLPDVLRALSNRKPEDITAPEAEMWHEGYRRLQKEGFLPGGNSFAHRAWVTMRWEKAQIERQAWTHHVTVSTVIAGEMIAITERAVSEAQAFRLAAKMRRDQRYRLGVDRHQPFKSAVRPVMFKTAEAA